MTDAFEDHCWKDVVTPDLLEIYSSYRRKIFVGPNPALLAVDLYEVVYRGGDRPPLRPLRKLRANQPAMRAAPPPLPRR